MLRIPLFYAALLNGTTIAVDNYAWRLSTGGIKMNLFTRIVCLSLLLIAIGSMAFHATASVVKSTNTAVTTDSVDFVK